jgi:hypothetical protein
MGTDYHRFFIGGHRWQRLFFSFKAWRHLGLGRSLFPLEFTDHAVRAAAAPVV